MINIIRSVFCSIFFLLFIRCSENAPVAGGGLDTESSGGKLTGSVIFPNGDPGLNTMVKLVPFNYSPFSHSSIKTTLTDDTGSFWFDGIDSGSYNIEAVNINSGTRLLHSDVKIIKDSLITVGHDTLHLPGSIIISLQDSIGSGFFYIPGTTISKRVSPTSKRILIDSVPVASALSLFYRKDSQISDSLISNSIEIRSEDTSFIDLYSSWAHTHKLNLNTSNSGNYIASDLFSIPVLIRFTANNFDFSQIHINNENIRFSKSEGTQLFHEVDSWDTVIQTGEIWILLDTLYGNRESQQITMQWGNNKSIIAIDSYSVFDTAKGFRGVWHIAGEKSGIRNHELYKDATVYNNHGDDFIHARGIDGIIGSGKEFNGEDDYILIGDTGIYHFESDPFTFSMWFNKSDSGKGTLMTYKFAPDEEIGIISDSSNRIFVYEMQGGDLDTICKSSSLTSGQWHYVNVIRIDIENFKLYVDGEFADQNTSGIVLGGDENGKGLFIGSNINAESEPVYPFKGYIDEVRIESAERSADWVRFNFMNQK